MSHFDKLVRLPEGFVVVAKTANSEFAGIAHQSKPIFGVFVHHKLDSRHSSPHFIIHWPRCCAFARLFFSLLVTYESPSNFTHCELLTNSRSQQACNSTPSSNTYAYQFLSTFPPLRLN